MGYGYCIVEDYAEPWTAACLNCNQEYQNELKQLKLWLMHIGLIHNKNQYPCHPDIMYLNFPCDPYNMYAASLEVKIMHACYYDGEVGM